MAVTAEAAPQTVREWFKANATRALRQPPAAIANEKVWTRGGDIEILDDAEALEKVVTYSWKRRTVCSVANEFTECSEGRRFVSRQALAAGSSAVAARLALATAW
jgi:hypothetical protein